MAEKLPEPEDTVKLKPLLGIRPGVYLTVLYSLVIITILFLVLIRPGLKSPGSVLVLKTEPYGAALRVDGVYMGTCADKIFVPKGRRTLEVVLPGFESIVQVHDIPGRVFGSALFPSRYPVEFTLKAANPTAAFAQAAADFAEWTFAGEPNSVWQIPLSLSEGAYRTGPSGDPASEEILRAALGFAVTRASLRDIVRAKMLLDNGGLSPSPLSITGSVSDILQFLSDNAGSAGWLASLLPPESAAIVRGSNWFKTNQESSVSGLDPLPERSARRRLNFYGMSFIEIQEKGIMICEAPVSMTVFQSAGIERSEYTEMFFDTTADLNDIAVVVTWFEAEEFCKWLSARLPSEAADMQVRLPAENEWEYAAMTNSINTWAEGWEWGNEPFAHLNFIKTQDWAKEAVGSPEKVILKEGHRSSMPPEFASALITFRPALVMR